MPASRFVRRLGFALATTSALLLAACASGDTRPPLVSTANIDLPRYMGAWYVIANTEYFGEKGDVASQDVYALEDDGDIGTVYRYHKGFGEPEKTLASTGVVEPGTNNTYWRIRFFGVLHADYLILETAPDYSWALIGQPDRDKAWVFSRTPRMDDALYTELIGKMQGFGYDTARIKKVPQLPEQLGQPGFHPAG